KPPAVTPKRVRGLLEVVDRFDLVILDAWGVLNLGDTPIARARSVVRELRGRGVRLTVLSNDASGDKAQAVATHRRRGYDFSAQEIVAGLDLLPETLARLALPAPLGLIADPPAPTAPLTDGMIALEDEASAYEKPSGVAFLSSGGWTEARQRHLRESLRRRPRPLIVCNPDIASPEGDMLNAEPGYYAHRIAEATAVVPILCGKPERAIYERALARFPTLRPERVLGVGDTLHTDILGARAAGCRAMLVEDGFCAGRDAMALAADCGIWPDFIAPGI
ncbi:MAG: HAD-IIA family hydrolase, partial [Acidobacteriota bacterium]